MIAKKTAAFVFAVASLVPIVAAQEPADLLEQAAAKETAALAAIARADVRGAVDALSAYEALLLEALPPPRFAMGLLEDDVSHVAFHADFEGWKELGPDVLDRSALMPGVGRPLLALGGAEPQAERFVALLMDLERLLQRMGACGEEFGPENALTLAAAILNNLGARRSEKLETIAGHRVLLAEMDTDPFAPAMHIGLVSAGRRVLMFMLSRRVPPEENAEGLRSILRTLDVAYDLPAATGQGQRSGGSAASTEPKAVLTRVRDLAASGAYDAATADLSALRIDLLRKAGAVLEGNVARMPAYGVVLKNPDPGKWKLEIQNTGGLQTLILSDRFSVDEAGICVGVLDTVSAWGPAVVKDMQDEAKLREMLRNAGRGSALNIGRGIRSERFRTFRTTAVAYEAIVDLPAPTLRGKVMWAYRSGFGLMVLMIAPARGFEETVAGYEQMLEGALQFADERKQSHRPPDLHRRIRPAPASRMRPLAPPPRPWMGGR